MSALIAIAKTLGRRLVLPSLAVEESVSARRREADATFVSLNAAHKRASRYSELVTTYTPSADEIGADWRKQLEEKFEIIEVPPHLAAEALRRETHRVPPARGGKGGRDSAIWLTILNDLPGNGESFFVSANTLDFGDPSGSAGALNASLEAECADAGSTLVYCTSVDELLAIIAPPVILEAAIDELVGAGDVAQAIRSAIDTELIPRLLIRRVDDGSTVGVDAYATTPLQIMRSHGREARAYNVGEASCALLALQAFVSCEIGVLSRNRRSVNETVVPIVLDLNANIWVTLTDGRDGVAAADIPNWSRIEIRSRDPQFTVALGTNSQ